MNLANLLKKHEVKHNNQDPDKQQALEICRHVHAYLKVPIIEEGPPTFNFSSSDLPVIDELGNGLGVAYLFDQEDHFRYLNQGILNKAGLTKEEILEIGISNLKILANEKMKVMKYEKVYSVFLDGNFEASLILVDELWDSIFSKFVINGFSIAIPARDILAFCDSNSKEGLEELKKIKERVFKGGDHLLTNHLYTRKNKVWSQLDYSR